MPQADLSYSKTLEFDVPAVLAKIEEIIGAHDTTSGACKGRAHGLETTHHDHVLLRLRMLDKPHRDDAFLQRLLKALQAGLREAIPAPCIIGVEIGFLEKHYASQTLT